MLPVHYIYGILFWKHCIFLVLFTCGASAENQKTEVKEKNKTEFSVDWLSNTATVQSLEKTALKKHFLQLGLVCVWTRVCHAENPPAGMGQVGPKLIPERLSPEGLPSWEWRNWKERKKDTKKEGESDRDRERHRGRRGNGNIFLIITAGKTADGHIDILRNINLICHAPTKAVIPKMCLVLNVSRAYWLILIQFAVEEKKCFCRWSLNICSDYWPFSQDKVWHLIAEKAQV